jgi:hypothetical protein
MKPYCSSITVTTGIIAFFIARFTIMGSGGTPLACAVVTYSRPRTSSMLDRIRRATRRRRVKGQPRG